MQIFKSSNSTRSAATRSVRATFIRSLRTLACVAAPALSALACGAAMEGDLGQEEGFEGQVETEELSQFLDSNESACGEAAADKSYTSVFGSFTSPNTYADGKNGCWGAYFVDVKNYRTGDDGAKYNRVDWGDSALNTKAKCEAANLRVYVFEKLSNGHSDYIDSTSMRGVWNAGATFPPGADCGGLPCINIPASCALGINIDASSASVAGKFNLTAGKNYKFALSARDYKDPSAPVFKKLKLSALRKQLVL